MATRIAFPRHSMSQTLVLKPDVPPSAWLTRLELRASFSSHSTWRIELQACFPRAAWSSVQARMMFLL